MECTKEEKQTFEYRRGVTPSPQKTREVFLEARTGSSPEDVQDLEMRAMGKERVVQGT